MVEGLPLSRAPLEGGARCLRSHSIQPQDTLSTFHREGNWGSDRGSPFLDGDPGR